MKRVDRTRTLTQLEGKNWGSLVEYPTTLVQRCHELRNVPLGHLTLADVRLLLGQNIGVAYLLPIALETLLAGPIFDEELYPGALLQAACRARPEYFATAPAHRYALGRARRGAT